MIVKPKSTVILLEYEIKNGKINPTNNMIEIIGNTNFKKFVICSFINFPFFDKYKIYLTKCKHYLSLSFLLSKDFATKTFLTKIFLCE